MSKRHLVSPWPSMFVVFLIAVPMAAVQVGLAREWGNPHAWLNWLAAAVWLLIGLLGPLWIWRDR